MTPETAAKKLRDELNAPQWALSVRADFDDGEGVLLVRVDPQYRVPLGVPERFLGYVVRVESRRPGFAYLN